MAFTGSVPELHFIVKAKQSKSELCRVSFERRYAQQSNGNVKNAE